MTGHRWLGEGCQAPIYVARALASAASPIQRKRAHGDGRGETKRRLNERGSQGGHAEPSTGDDQARNREEFDDRGEAGPKSNDDREGKSRRRGVDEPGDNGKWQAQDEGVQTGIKKGAASEAKANCRDEARSLMARMRGRTPRSGQGHSAGHPEGVSPKSGKNSAPMVQTWGAGGAPLRPRAAMSMLGAGFDARTVRVKFLRARENTAAGA